MGNGMCYGGGVQVVPSYLVDQNIDVQGLVARSRARGFPLEATTKSSPSDEGPRVSDLSGRSGQLMLFLEFLRDVPYQDTLRDLTCEAVSSKSHGRPYVKAWVEAADGTQLGQAAEWPPKPCNEAPTWYSAQPLGVPLDSTSSAILRLELWDGRTLLASQSTPLGAVRAHASQTCELEPRTGWHKRPCLISFQILNSETVMKPRTVYFVRHGESVWNKAQSKMQLHEMARTTDHPLSAKGRLQAESLSSRLAALAGSGKVSANVAGLLRPDAVFVSPLTRAVETAVIGLGPQLVHSLGNSAEMLLMANAREKQNFGGLDTRSTKVGTEILQRVLDELKASYKGQDSDILEVFKQIHFDTLEVQDRWWCENMAEQPAQLQVRLREFMAQLMYSPHTSIAVVGHSHFFRSVFKNFLSDAFREKRRQFSWELSNMKLPNCGVACLTIDPAAGLSGGPITSVELVLGTELLSDSSILSCCTTPGMPGEYIEGNYKERSDMSNEDGDCVDNSASPTADLAVALLPPPQPPQTPQPPAESAAGGPGRSTPR